MVGLNFKRSNNNLILNIRQNRNNELDSWVEVNHRQGQRQDQGSKECGEISADTVDVF